MKISHFSLLLLTLYTHTSNSMAPQRPRSIFDFDLNYFQIENILKYKCNLDLPIDMGFGLQIPPLHVALRNPHLHDFIEPLLQAGANPNNKFHCMPMQVQLAPLHCIAGDKDKISYLHLLLEYKADVNITDEKHKTPLMVAVKYGNYEGAQVLLRHGASPNIQKQGGNTVHHELVDVESCVNYAFKESVIKLLLHYGANPYIKNKWGRTALDITRENGFDNLAKLMKN